MLLYGDQHTPPFNSPRQQQDSRHSSLLESPYPSPVRHDARLKYVQGLGLYNYPSSLPTDLPPSPQPSEVWNGHLSSGVSPLMAETNIADPWTSGAFDHPVSQSPLPWASTHTTPRSSLSSCTPCTREMSVYSHEGSEQAYTGVKVEYSGWGPDMRWEAADATQMHGLTSSPTSPLTVTPEQVHSDVFPYEHSYGATTAAKLESTTMYESYDGREFGRALSEDSTVRLRSKPPSNYSTAGVPRERGRSRRLTDPATALFTCNLCPNKGFARKYNYRQHMLTHDLSRKKDNVCPVHDCGRAFVRKTDLARHDRSVHQKSKPYQCLRCPSVFPRKDTLRRHEDDGCHRRNQVPVTDPRMFTQLRHEGYTPATGL